MTACPHPEGSDQPGAAWAASFAEHQGSGDLAARIAIDAMGGDHGPGVIVPAVLKALATHGDLAVILVGDETALGAHFGQIPETLRNRLEVRHASQVVAMDDLPSQALRTKRASSMRIAIDLVREGTADACVSAGNTGALMAIARFVLKMVPGIDRPAICATLPGVQGHTYMLDLGANVDCSSEELFQFAVMGAVLAGSLDGNDNPSVALLNIGAEEIKGNDRVKQTAALLADSGLNFVGYAEGNDIYAGRVDVIVCDGFVGNVALKSSEGVARMLMHFAREEFSRSLWRRIAALIARPVLRRLRERADPGRYNGASLLGLRGIVVKSHGNADVDAFAHAVAKARVEVEQGVPERIASRLESLLLPRGAT